VRSEAQQCSEAHKAGYRVGEGIRVTTEGEFLSAPNSLWKPRYASRVMTGMKVMIKNAGSAPGTGSKDLARPSFADHVRHRDCNLAARSMHAVHMKWIAGFMQ